MNTDKRNLYLISVFIPAALVPIMFIQSNYCRIVAAIVLAAAAGISLWSIKKRTAHSVNYRRVTALLAVISFVYLMFTCLLGIWLGFQKNTAPLSLDTFLRIVLPTAAIIVFSELVRHVLVSRADTVATVSAYIGCILADILIWGGLSHIDKLSHFLDIVGLALFPAVTSNLFYHYLTKRYGAVSVIVYRLILTLPLSLLPVVPAISDAINSFLLMLLPLFVWMFIDLLYEKKAKYALGRKSRWSFVGIGASIACMAAVIMLISGSLPYKLIVIATPSMTGEINQGDAVIYEEYDGQVIDVDSIVVFTKNDSDLIVHRVINAQQIDGTVYYTTKGDANESSDSGFITAEDLRGVVLIRLPQIGNPTLWLRELFS